MTTAMQEWMDDNPDVTVVNDSSEPTEDQVNWNDEDEAEAARESTDWEDPRADSGGSDDTASVEVTDVQSTRSPSAQERQRANNSDDSLADVVQESREDNDPDASDVVAGMPTNAIETVLGSSDTDMNIGAPDVTVGDVAEQVGIDPSNLPGASTGSSDPPVQDAGTTAQDRLAELLASLRDRGESAESQLPLGLIGAAVGVIGLLFTITGGDD